MEQECSILENNRRTSYFQEEQLPIACQDSWMIESKGVNYYMSDLKKTGINAINDIIDECRIVENESWKAQEDFYDYIQKCDVLSYAVINGRIVGFDAASLFYHDTTCMFCNDETMVLKEFRNRNIARNLVFATMRWFIKNRTFKGIKHFVFMSISGNPRIVNGYYKHSGIIKILFDCSFNASDELVDLMDAYRNKYKISLVHKDYPFCVKNMFPGSNAFNHEEIRVQFLNVVKKALPKDFDYFKRGDAFAFLVKVSKNFAFKFVFVLMVIAYGKKFFSHKGIGIFARDAD